MFDHLRTEVARHILVEIIANISAGTVTPEEMEMADEVSQNEKENPHLTELLQQLSTIRNQ